MPNQRARPAMPVDGLPANRVGLARNPASWPTRSANGGRRRSPYSAHSKKGAVPEPWPTTSAFGTGAHDSRSWDRNATTGDDRPNLGRRRQRWEWRSRREVATPKGDDHPNLADSVSIWNRDQEEKECRPKGDDQPNRGRRGQRLERRSWIERES